VSILVDLLIAAALAYAAVIGTRRGMVLISLELNGYIIAAIVALAAYRPLGAVFSHWLHALPALSNVAAFTIVWIVTELVFTALVRYKVIPFIEPNVHLSKPNRVGGGLLGAVKGALLFTLLLIAFDGLPLPYALRSPILDAALPHFLLSATTDLNFVPASGIGRDFSDSISFFTVPADAKNEKTIQLGYTTTNVSVDARDEEKMFEYLNHERTTRGLLPLRLNVRARVVARDFSTDMFARGYFSHVDPEGQTPFDRMTAGGVTYKVAGENLALSPTVELAHEGLMKSPGHRANILSPDYHAVGIGIVNGGPNGIMVTQDFTD
jgi:uncharacterized protein YkwD/uncharacterized membrane protein required for colicin V production